MDQDRLTPQVLLRAYAMGVFPMAETRDDPEVFWVDPRRRGVLPLERFHISRSLARAIRREDYQISCNQAFTQVVEACADRDETWINDVIFGLYGDLHDMGFAHSLEVWREDQLIGGVYGVALGRAFFGESMFSRADNGSKIALAYLTDRLLTQGYILFDTQFITSHLRSLGAIEITRMQYHQRLARALQVRAEFPGGGPMASAQEVLQRKSQTS